MAGSLPPRVLYPSRQRRLVTLTLSIIGIAFGVEEIFTRDTVGKLLAWLSQGR